MTGFPRPQRPASVQRVQTQQPARIGAVVDELPPPLFLPKKIVVPFFQSVTEGANARDRRGLNLQAKCVVTERNAEPSI